MKTKSIIFLVAILTLSCGSSKSNAYNGGVKIPVSEFTSISASSGIEIYFTEGKSASVEVEKEYDGDTYVEAKVRNGKLTLSVDTKGKNHLRNLKLRVHVSCKNLEGLSLSGGVKFVTNKLNGDSKSISASGGANINIDRMKLNKLNLSTSGGASLDFGNIEGNSLKISSSGGSRIEANIAKAKDVRISSSGGARVILKGGTVDKVSASASGAATIDIRDLKYGDASTSQSGSGKVRK